MTTPGPPTTTIYQLIDPRTGEVRYIGRTRGTLAERLRKHLERARYRPTSAPCQVWLRELVAAGLRPTIAPICEVDAREAQLAELGAISAARAAGAQLTNVVNH